MFFWIDKALALAIHDRQLAEHGGSAGLRDERLLESALARPEQLLAYADPEPDLADLATSLAYSVARNHPFIDGNKRTAAVVCETFIELNDAQLEVTDAELFPRFIALAEGKLKEETFAEWLRPHIRTRAQVVQEEAVTYAATPRRRRKKEA